MPRDLALGRVYLPAEDRRRFDVDGARPAEPGAAAAARVRGRAGARAARRRARRSGGGSAAAASAGRSALFARGGLAALEALERADWDIFNGRPRPSRARLARWRRSSMSVEAAYAEVERLTRREARNFAYGIMRAAADRSGGRSRRSTPSRAASTTSPTASCRSRRSARAWRRCARRSTRLPARTRCSSRSPTRARATRSPTAALHDLVDGGLQDTEQDRYADFDELDGYCRRVAGAVGVACVAVYGSDDVERAETLGVALQLINIMRDVARGLGARPRLPAAGRARPLRRRRGRHRRRPRHAGVAGADGVPGLARAGAPRRTGSGCSTTLDRRSAALRRHLRGALPGDARPDRGARLRRLRRRRCGSRR